jgi:hypothetical protein
MTVIAGPFIQQANGIRVINAADMLETAPLDPDQVLEDMLDAGDKLALVASSKHRKSFFFLMLALALAAGRNFMKWRVPRARRVLYVQFEVREHHTHRRLRNLAHAMGITSGHIGDRLQIIPARGLGLKGEAGLTTIRQAAIGFEPEVIMLDPLYKIADGVENAAEDFKKLLNGFDQLAEETGAAIMFIHHDPKGASGDKDIRDRGAGSNVLGRDYDACITLTAHSNAPDAIVVETLLRNYAPQEPFTIVWKNGEGGYCFDLAEDIIPNKKTSKSKPQPAPVSTFLPQAKEILLAGRELEIKFFKSLFKEKTGLSNARVNDFVNWATGGEHSPLEMREERGYCLHKKMIRMPQGYPGE